MTWGVPLASFTSPPDPLSSRRGGNMYSWGTPPDPRQREIPLDSLYNFIVRQGGEIVSPSARNDDGASLLDRPVKPDDDPMSRMMTPDVYPRGVPLASFTSPLDPLSSRRGGISIAWGHPQTPASGKSLWTSFTTIVVRHGGEIASPSARNDYGAWLAMTKGFGSQ